MKKKSGQFSKLIHRSLIVVALCSMFTILMYFFGIFDFLENKSFDNRTVTTAKYAKSSEDIILIAINQDCIDYAKENYGWSWPWPRSAYGKMVEFISAGNVNSIVFDILFTEDSVYGHEDDEEFGYAIKDSGKVIQTLYVKGKSEDSDVLYPVDSIKNSAAIIANSTSIKDKDDVIRKARIYSEINGEQVPSMGIAPLLLNNEQLKKLPVQKDGSVILRFQRSIKSYTFRYATDILESYESWKKGEEGIYVPEDFDDSYVYFALYGPGLFDICASPVSQVYPGVGIHITQLDNYLNDNFIKKVPVFFVLIWIVFMSLAGSLIVVFGQYQRSQFKNVVIIIAGFIFSVLICVFLPYLLFIFGIWLPLVAPVAVFILSFLVTLGLVYLIEGKQRRFIRTAFSQCLAKEIVKQIEEHPETFKLGGEKVDMTAVFTDIRKFSSFSELLSPAEVVALLNFYLTGMSDVIMEEGGTIDKYEGDAIVALVGAPFYMENHADRAVRAALRMKEFEKEMNIEIKNIVQKKNSTGIDEELYSAFEKLVENQKKIFTRIGINSGEMIVGYMGSNSKKNYTMMGSNVNLASRLEGVNKQYNTNGILISEFTKNKLDDSFILRKLDNVKVVNVNTPVRLYEPLGVKPNLSVFDEIKNLDQLSEYAKNWDFAMEFFEKKNYSEALNQFKSLSELNKEDKVAKYYINLIEKYFIKGVYPTENDGEGVSFNPEDGIFTLLQK